MPKSTTKPPSLTELQREIRVLRKELAAVRHSTALFLTDLRDPNYRLKRPLPVTLEYEGDVVFASVYDVDMYGEGEDAQEAIDDLCDCLLEYYEFLAERAPKLGPVPARDWRILSRLIQRVKGKR